MKEGLEKIVFGGGCFWCTEAVFNDITGVVRVVPGYSGGIKDNPNYEEVCDGDSGYIEVVEVIFDPQIVSLDQLLDVFFSSHDPTSQDKQGADTGSQYRSVIFCTSDQQKEIVNNKIASLNKILEQKIVTEIRPLQTFFAAENYHHNYYAENPNRPYCQIVINPKIEKIKKTFPNLIKNNHD